MKRFVISCALLTITHMLAHAADPQILQQATDATENDNPFAEGKKELENVAGPYFFMQFLLHTAPALDYAVNSMRGGIMLNNPHGTGPLAGNVEILGEVFAGGTFDPGGVLAGSTLFFRYNFIQPRTRFIPYIQGGGGIFYTSVAGHPSRDTVSAPVEFNLQTSLGTRYRLDRHWSVLVEVSYRHVSNAGLHEPNYGINSVGGNIGLGYLF